ncbi:DUF441 domain-containing protein [Caldalkalibacillus salinus]|uniref:DUF441 domain-containing protein n=1 Tax=Caldalkalibacillus salinus TaxID=2803787 RepID=UPI0019249035|nr:DUF441 domain-containing protein [Caldalkalibacillus salinus]
MKAEFILLALVIIGLIGRSPIIATAASCLLVIRLASLHNVLVHLDERSLELGLLCLTMAVLVPFATERIRWKDMKVLITTPYGLIALIGGATATYLNGKGLDLLQADPEMIIGLVVGSIAGIVLLRGVPVGPLMAAGITVLLLQIFKWFT